MIGKQFSTPSISQTLDYLRVGREGLSEEERVAWATTRNLPTEDLDLSELMMESTASMNHRLKAPGYHFSISFDPGDRPTRAQMEMVADRAIAALGLDEHQAVIVAHKDREHAHFHVLVNRVHPETLKGWDRWQDRVKLQKALREMERELSFREVPGRLYALEGQALPDYQVPSWQVHRHRSTGQLPFQDAVKEAGLQSELQAAANWRDLEERLAGHGLELKRAGRGLQLTDGHEVVKASAVDRGSSLKRLEDRFGESYRSYLDRVGLDRPDPGPSRELVAALRDDVAAWAEFEGQLQELDQSFAPQEEELKELMRQHPTPRGGVAGIDQELKRLQPNLEVSRSLAAIYKDPDAARTAIHASLEQSGSVSTYRELGERPEAFGKLPLMSRRTSREVAAATSQQALSQHAARIELVEVRKVVDGIRQKTVAVHTAKREARTSILRGQLLARRALKRRLHQLVKSGLPAVRYLSLARSAIASPHVVAVTSAIQLTQRMIRSQSREGLREREGPSLEF